MYDAPAHVWALALTGAVGIPATTVAVLHRSATVLRRRQRTAITVIAGAALTGWLGLSTALAAAGAYRPHPGSAAPWLIVVVAAALAGMLAATAIPPVARILAEPGALSRLTWPHTVRIAGAVFVVVMAEGHLPAAFALPAGLGDIAVGLAAPVIARRLAADPEAARHAAVRFHLLGIVDLVVAGAIGFLLFGLIDATPSTAALRDLPLALVPTLAVPLAVTLHVISLRQLRQLPQRAAVSRCPAAAPLG